METRPSVIDISGTACSWFFFHSCLTLSLGAKIAKSRGNSELIFPPINLGETPSLHSLQKKKKKKWKSNYSVHFETVPCVYNKLIVDSSLDLKAESDQFTHPELSQRFLDISESCLQEVKNLCGMAERSFYALCRSPVSIFPISNLQRYESWPSYPVSAWVINSIWSFIRPFFGLSEEKKWGE